MIIEPFKMKVNPEQSKMVQEILFANGYKWKNGVQSILRTELPYLYFNEDRKLAHSENDLDYFVHSHLKEISFNEFVSRYTGVVEVSISGADLCGLFSRKNIPEKWCIRVTLENYKELNKWLILQPHFNSAFILYKSSYGFVGNCRREGSYQDWCDSGDNFKKLGHKEITFEQFKKYILKNDVDEYTSTLREILIKSGMKKQYVIVTNSGASFDTHTDAGKYGCINYHYWKRLPHAKNGDKLEIVKEIMVNGYDPSYILKDAFGIEYIIKKSGVKLIDEIMKKEIIGYRIKEQFRNNRAVGEAAAKIEGHRCFGDGVTELPFSKLAISCLQNTNEESIEKLKKAGVLDLWFELVYKEIEPEIEISGYKAQFDLQNKTVKFGCKTISLEQLKAVLIVMDLNKQFDDNFIIGEDTIAPNTRDEFECVPMETIKQLIQILEK
jgi:hypothetical protein